MNTMYLGNGEDCSRGKQLLENSALLEMFKRKFVVIHYIREYMYNVGAVEVEVPYLNKYREGAPLGQFQTIDPVTNERLFLRHSPENYLRRVAPALEHIYELGKNFRIEEEDDYHANEFLVLEDKSTLHDYESGMAMLVELIKYALVKVYGDCKTDYFDMRALKYVKFDDLFLLNCGFRLDDPLFKEKCINLLKDYELPLSKELYDWEILELIQSHLIERNIVEPTIIIDYPQPLQHFSPYNKKRNSYERFSLIINGVEVCDGGMKFDNVEEYRAVLEENEDYARRYLGMSDFIVSPFMYSDVECSKANVFSFGLGIDRLFAICEGKKIHDVILFPCK